ncbi:MAG: hypothetical protein HY898_31410 [Deltaproteobacteria bacterium]|nr:hypothetical protein [Deltaproteobacteria bacterium]
MMLRCLGPSIAFALPALLWSGPALAQDTVVAEALFNQGLAQLDSGDFASACPKLQESYRLDPKPGALFALADCNARWGKVASAVAHYQDYLGMVMRLSAPQQARHRDRVAKARAEIAAIKPSVPELELVLPNAAPPGTVVKRDGVELGPAALGTSLPVDPGRHEITTQAPGGKVVSTWVEIALRDKKTLVLVVAPPPAPPAAPARSASPPAYSQPGSSGAWTTAAWIAGGVGALGVLAGSVTGLLVFGKKDTIDANCTGLACNARGKSAADSAQDLALVSTVGMSIGALGAGTALCLVLLRPRASRPAEALGWQPQAVWGSHGAWIGASRSW